jgi:hypothetical protein
MYSGPIHPKRKEKQMNHHRQKVLDALFAHPISANIEFKDVEHVLTDLGADIQDKGEKITVTLSGRTVSFHRPHGHTLPKDEVAQIRDFLKECGIEK